MTFKEDHWEKPRETIAHVYKDNDMAYATHGIYCAYDILNILDERPSTLKNKTVLDYGCGTGKNTRAIHYFFQESVGYDPVKGCIKVALEEFEYINQEYSGFPGKINLLIHGRLSFTSEISEIINTQFDVIFATNVLEHLKHDIAKIALDNMLQMLKPSGKIIFNTFAVKSKELLDEYSAKESLMITNSFGYYTITKK